MIVCRIFPVNNGYLEAVHHKIAPTNFTIPNIIPATANAAKRRRHDFRLVFVLVSALVVAVVARKPWTSNLAPSIAPQ